MLLLRDRGDDLAAAGIRPFGISRDSPWSHASWADDAGGRQRSAALRLERRGDEGIRRAVRAPGHDGGRRAQRVPDRGRYGQGLVDARERDAGRGRRDRGGFVALALVLYAACALWATWPAVQHIDGRYLARPAAGDGEAAAGDHLQLGWAFWLPGHQLEHGGAPWADPYTFRPEASASPNLQGWLLGIPFWPLRALLGNIWAYNLVVLLSIAAAGALTCWWLRALGLARGAALVGGLVFALAPYRLGQSTGHLLGLIAFLLPAVLLALERRRFTWAAIALTAIPLSGQIHLAMGAVVLALGYTWARVPRADWWKAGAGAVAAVGGGSHRAAGRRGRLDREWRPLLRPGAALLGRALRPRHARGRSGHRGVRVPRLADPGSRPRRPLGDPASARARGLPRARAPSCRACWRSARACRCTSRSGRRCPHSASRACPSA